MNLKLKCLSYCIFVKLEQWQSKALVRDLHVSFAINGPKIENQVLCDLVYHWIERRATNNSAHSGTNKHHSSGNVC
jgi:hypothetical protein